MELLRFRMLNIFFNKNKHMKNKSFVFFLWAICPLILSPTNGWSNKEDLALFTENYSCTNFKLTATPNGVYCGEETGSIEIAITGGTAPYLIEWDNSNMSIWEEASSDADTYTIPDLPRGMYLIKVRDANGCFAMTSVMMDDNASDLTYTITPSGPCVTSGSLEFNVAGSSPPYWVILEGPRSGAAIFNSNQFKIEDLPAGEYTVIIDKDGCGHTQRVTLVTTPVPLSLSIEIDDHNICDALGGLYLNIAGGTPRYYIQWYGASSGSTQSEGAKYIQSLIPGDYTFVIRDANGCTTSASATVEATLTDLACILTQTPVVCDNMGQIGVTISGGKPAYKVSYSGPVSGTVAATTTGEKTGTASIWDLPPGTYTVKVSDSRGCIAVESITVGGEITDLACVLRQTPVICDNMGQIGVTITGGAPDYSVSYTGPVSGTIAASTIGDRLGSATIHNLPEGTYTITVRDTRGCLASESITVGGMQTDLACIVTATPVICNVNGSIGVTISGGQPNYRVDYAGPVSGSITVSGSTTLPDMPNGNYTITVTDSRGCQAIGNVTVGGEFTDLACVLRQTPVICDNMGQIGVTITGGAPDYSVSYTGPVSGTIAASTIGDRLGSATIHDLPEGVYTVTVTDTRGCTASESITVGGMQTDLVCIVTATPVICGVNGSIGVNISGGQPNYRVDYAGPVSGSIMVSGSTTLPDLPKGYYTITVTDSRGCQAVENIDVGGAPDLSNTMAISPNICSSLGAITANITGGTPGYTVSYTGPISGTVYSDGPVSLPDLPEGNYTVTVTDASGCSVSESVYVGTRESDLICRLVQQHVICDKKGAIDVIISGGQANYTISWTGPSSGSVNIPQKGYIIPDLSPGTYTISIVDANGCTASEATTVREVPSDLSYELFPNAGQSEGSGWFELRFISGTPFYTVVVTGPDNYNQTTIVSGNTVFDKLASGNYTVSVTDANGCQLDKQVSISKGDNMFIINDDHSVNVVTTHKVISKATEVETDRSSLKLEVSNTSRDFKVHQNFPNPFTNHTTIGFELPESMVVVIMVHDHFGRTVSMIQKTFDAGFNQYILNGEDFGPGVFYYTVKADAFSKTRRMVRVKY